MIIYVDRLMTKWQVMHRARAASLSSRSTVSRRIASGDWWRPTALTVAAKTEFPDPAFDLLVAAAHCWPNGGVAGSSLPGLFGLKPGVGLTEISIPRGSNVAPAPNVHIHRRSQIHLTSFTIPSGREIAIDVGSPSLVAAMDELAITEAPWVLVRAAALARYRGGAAEVCDRLVDYLPRIRCGRKEEYALFGRAVAHGCESSGEVYVWIVLASLGVKFRCQQRFVVGADGADRLGRRHVRADFVIETDDPAAPLIIEVDSALHVHLDDVRRDLWNLIEGRRTLRVVGTDVVAHPEVARRQLAAALHQLGVSMQPVPLPDWIRAA